MYYISDHDIIKFISSLKNDYDVYFPVKKENNRFYKRFENDNHDITIGEVRPFEPLKGFFFKAREVVAEGFKQGEPESKSKPYCILGVKACDQKGFKIQDHVFLNDEYIDPFYKRAREENLIIATDCTCTIDTCFCTALGIKPYAEDNFDINLSQVKGGFITEVGSKRGSNIIESNIAFFKNPQEELLNEKKKLRRKIIAEVEKNIENFKIPHQDSFSGIIEKNYNADLWQDEAQTCVECGACNSICPTCHCFLLYDQKDKEKMARLRVWDSCMIKDFAKVAGGANPREKLWMRLRNRFEKKFDYFPKLSNIYACTGCGRCISACPAKIDIRKVLNRLVTNV